MTIIKQAEKSIKRFIIEAKKCSKEELGFSSLLTAFPIMLCVAEAIIGTKTDKELISWFIDKCKAKNKWIKKEGNDVLTNDEVFELITGVRNGLVHELSLPTNVVLVGRINRNIKRINELIYIDIVSFIDDLQKTTIELIQKYPNSMIDPSGENKNREIAIEILRIMV